VGFLPVALATSRGEPPLDKRVISIYEDSRGDLWIGTIRALYRRTRNSEVFEYHQDKKVRLWADELWNQVLEARRASAFAEDQSGAVWIGYYDGMLARYRDGKMTLFGPADGLTGGGTQAPHVDHAGRFVDRFAGWADAGQFALERTAPFRSVRRRTGFGRQPDFVSR